MHQQQSSLSSSVIDLIILLTCRLCQIASSADAALSAITPVAAWGGVSSNLLLARNTAQIGTYTSNAFIC